MPIGILQDAMFQSLPAVCVHAGAATKQAGWLIIPVCLPGRCCNSSCHPPVLCRPLPGCWDSTLLGGDSTDAWPPGQQHWQCSGLQVASSGCLHTVGRAAESDTRAEPRQRGRERGVFCCCCGEGRACRACRAAATSTEGVCRSDARRVERWFGKLTNSQCVHPFSESEKGRSPRSPRMLLACSL